MLELRDATQDIGTVTFQAFFDRQFLLLGGNHCQESPGTASVIRNRRLEIFDRQRQKRGLVQRHRINRLNEFRARLRYLTEQPGAQVVALRSSEAHVGSGTVQRRSPFTPVERKVDRHPNNRTFVRFIP